MKSALVLLALVAVSLAQQQPPNHDPNQPPNHDPNQPPNHDPNQPPNHDPNNPHQPPNDHHGHHNPLVELIHHEIDALKQNNPSLTTDECISKCDALFALIDQKDEGQTDAICKGMCE